MRDNAILFYGHSVKTATSILQHHGEQVLAQTGPAGTGAAVAGPSGATISNLIIPTTMSKNAGGALASARASSSPQNFDKAGTSNSPFNRMGSGPQSPATSPHSVSRQQFPVLAAIGSSGLRGLASFPDCVPRLDGVGEKAGEIRYAVTPQQEYKSEKMIRLFAVPGYLSLIANRPPPAGFNMVD
eukprot:g9110.t1